MDLPVLVSRSFCKVRKLHSANLPYSLLHRVFLGKEVSSHTFSFNTGLNPHTRTSNHWELCHRPYKNYEKQRCRILHPYTFNYLWNSPSDEKTAMERPKKYECFDWWFCCREIGKKRWGLASAIVLSKVLKDRGFVYSWRCSIVQRSDDA